MEEEGRGSIDMRQALVKVLLATVMVVSSFGLFVSAARADGGGSNFNSGDGRVNPITGDRLAVYLNNDGVVVWGIDPNNVGFDMTFFTVPELTSGKTVTHRTPEGTVTLKMISPAVWHVGFSDDTATTLTTIVDTGAVYAVSWVGEFGANGVGAYEKTFSATYALPSE